MRKVWTADSVGVEALKYAGRKAFATGSRGAHQAAKRFGIYDKVCSHMAGRWDNPLRDAAGGLGLKTYVTGEHCVNGHVDERFVADGKCVECCRSRDRGRYPARRQERVEYNKDYYQQNKERLVEEARKWAACNRGKRKEIVARYSRNNPYKAAANTMLRIAMKRQRTPPWLTREHLKEILDCYRCSQYLTTISGIPHHVDHIVPLRGKRVSGLHVPWNLQAIPAVVNLSKSNKHESG